MTTKFNRRHILKLTIGSTFLAPFGYAQDRNLISELQGGGHVIYFRHAATTWSGIDRIEWPRERQRLLSADGIAQSERIGQAFAQAQIPVGEVIASPFARCRDMAEIAFGRVEERMELLGLLSDDAGRAARVAYLREKLETPPAAGLNRIIVAHRSNIGEVANVSLAEGEAVITRPTSDGFAIIDQLMPDDWPVG
ncbi:histidine phosphatase family protein [Cognatiyoonia sp. IB215182]|uniref:histidine phosphatase family protein n=1 Tax=Cognatiyoonia sp. IB215182 TaxID=3097353 RepID=UPI002A141073|nr:histidine phosphatase family protein [Cognatiyoonia sp. IB215182]MDX8352459.1 histidine phosphatase family protein [Cognatiyoonia sp. IB215182]